MRETARLLLTCETETNCRAREKREGEMEREGEAERDRCSEEEREREKHAQAGVGREREKEKKRKEEKEREREPTESRVGRLPVNRLLHSLLILYGRPPICPTEIATLVPSLSHARTHAPHARTAGYALSCARACVSLFLFLSRLLSPHVSGSPFSRAPAFVSRGSHLG